MTNISVIVPIYNEEGNVSKLHQEIKEVCLKNNYEYEIIFINDGSTDNTHEICKNLYPLKYISLRRNFGQTAAMDIGIKNAQYNYIITMDGDRQNDPEDIPEMIRYLETNELDVVSGWRKNRKDSFMKKFVSRGANFLRSLLIKDNIHDSGCSLKVYKRECFKGVSLYGEQHRFIPAILKIKGFTIGEVAVNHRPRSSGKTKYTWHRTIKGFVDMISVWFWNKYATRPLHILGSFGILFLILGGTSGITSVVLFISGKDMANNVMWPLLTVFFVIIGLLMFILGLMSEILIKTYYGVQADTPYCVKEIINNKKY